MIHFEDFIMQDEADKYNMLQECNAYIKSKDKEIERLNNIINELENYVIDREERSWDDNGAYDDVLDKLQELKGSDNGVWVDNLLEVIKENNIEFGSDSND